MRKDIDMIAGIPGTGIGGLFYLIIALWMPVREFYLKVRKRGSARRRRLVKGHLFITASVIVGMWATGEFIGMILSHLAALNNGAALLSNKTQNILQVAPLLLTLATLVFVYMGIHVLRFCVVNNGKKDVKNV